MDHFGLHGKVEVEIGTLSKAFGVVGGVVAGNPLVVEWLRQRGRPFLFSSAMTVPDVAACLAAVDLHVRRAAPALVDLVQRADGRLAIEAAVALARLAGDDTGLPRVLQATAPGGADRLRAVEALRYFGDGAARTALQGLQSDPDPRIRAMAAASLLHRSAR